MSHATKVWDKPSSPRHTIFSTSGQDSIDSPNLAWEWMASHWDLPQALVGGTLAMREYPYYLPQGQIEGDAAYTRRRCRSFLLNAYRDAVNSIAAKPFQKPVTLSDATPDRLRDLSENVDLEGRTLTQFAHDLLWSALHHGLVHILVDFPVVTNEITLAEERELGLRPFWVMVPAPNLIGWRTQRMGGSDILTQIRIHESSTEQSGTYGEQCVDRIRVMTVVPGGIAWEVHSRARESESDSGGEYALVADGLVVGPKRIPLVTFYAKRTGFMTGLPVLEDLAWLNLAHWQSYSQQRTYLDTARISVPVASGFTEDEIPSMLEIGNKGIRSGEPAARFSFEESPGNALDAGRQDLKDLEEQMKAMKMRPLLPSPGDRTATEIVSNNVDTHASLLQIVRGGENSLLEAMKLSAEYMNEKIGDTKVNISDDFATLDGHNSQEIREMMALGQLSFETGWEELRRRGALSDDFDPKLERERLAKQNELDRLDFGPPEPIESDSGPPESAPDRPEDT